MSTAPATLDRRPVPDDRPGRRPAVALAVIATCYLMVTLDATVVNVALPKIQSSLHFSRTGLAWVLDAYMLTFGGLLLLGGRTGDVLGRRRVLSAGVAVFTVASVLGGLAPSAGWLLAARAAQGVGAAFVTPGTLALIATNFAEGPERNRALSVYSAVAGGGASVGLILGGVLTDLASWRWVLFINVPVGAAVLLLAPRYIAESERVPGRFDLAGAVSGTAGMSALVYGFIRASSDGWANRACVAALGLGALLLATFLAIEARAEQPILPLGLFANRVRAGAYATMMLVAAPMFAVFFFLTQFLQTVRGLGPFTAGLAFLPLATAMLVTVRTLPRILPRTGPRPILLTGLSLNLAAILWLARLSATSGYATALLGPLVLFGVGFGCSVLPLNLTILSGVDRGQTGAASGLLQTMQWVGASLGLSALVTVFGTASRHAAAHPVGGVLLTPHQVLTHGIAGALGAGAAFAVTALLVAALAVRPGAAPRRARWAPRPVPADLG
jgi:EmrB/QacA subfamily drug resistance transporter